MGVTKQIVSEEPPEELPLLPCHVCKRTFLPQPLKKHVLICEQMSRKKRKRFDSLKQRVEGTDLAPFFQQSYLKKSNPENNAYQVADRVKKRQSNWKANHLDLMNTIRTAKGVSPDFNSNAAVTNRKLVHVAANKRCPICDRGFGPRAFDRHVEWCRENKVKTAKSPCPDQQAKERLEARLNYRVPPLKVPKKVIREKYSPINQAKHPSNAIVASKNTTSLGSSPMVNMPMNPKKLVNNFAEEQGGKSRFHRNIGDGGENKEVIKSNELNTRSAHRRQPYNPFEAARRQLVELLEYDDKIKHSPVRTTHTTNQQHHKPHTTNRFDRSSIIEFEQLESLVNNNLLNNGNGFFANLENLRGDNAQRKYSDDISTIDPNLINENDNLSIPEHLPSNGCSPTSSTDLELNLRNFKPFVDSLENLDAGKKSDKFCQTKEGGNSNKIPFEPNIPSIKIGLSGGNEHKINRRNLKKSAHVASSSNKVNTDFSEKKRNGKITSTTNLHEPPDNKSTEDVKNNFIGQLENSGILNAVEPFSVDDELYQEYQKYEEMYLKERDRKTSSKRSKNKTADFGINIDDKVNKTCADSAYGSLNRKLHPKEAGSSKELEMEGKSSPGERMLKLPKFCHECGNKYPFDSVKFCVECGEKRLVL